MVGTLATCVQALPREIYDEIYMLTFAAHQQEVEITQNYKLPSVAKVDSTSRNIFAKSYSCAVFRCSDEYLLQKWLIALPDSHAMMLTDVRVVLPQTRDDAGPQVAESRVGALYFDSDFDALMQRDDVVRVEGRDRDGAVHLSMSAREFGVWIAEI